MIAADFIYLFNKFLPLVLFIGFEVTDRSM